MRMIDLDVACAALQKLELDDIEDFGVWIPECFPAKRAIEELEKIVDMGKNDVVYLSNVGWVLYRAALNGEIPKEELPLLLMIIKRAKTADGTGG